MRKPRKLKKAIRKATLIYDLAAIPKQMTVDRILKGFREGIVIWASQPSMNVSGRNASMPIVIPKSSRIKFIDVSHESAG